MRQVAKVCLAFLLITAQVFGQSSTGTPASTKKKTAAKANPVTAKLEQMEKAIEAQQQQIQQLQEQLKGRDSQVQQLQQQLTQTQATVSQTQQEVQAAAAKSVAPEQLDAVKKDVADLKDNSAGAALSLQETQKKIKEATESPMAIHYKGITITPGGFLAAETVYRNRALGADINTQLNGVNMPGAGQNRVSEFFGTGRQSRISMLAEGKLSDMKLSGWYEADFLSAGVTSNNNQSNSYTLRQRQLFGQVAYHDWTVTGGQMWSLITETKKGMDNRTEAVPLTIDPQYTVGFSWARQFGFRVVRNFNNHFWIGASVENPQTTISVRNAASNFALGAPGNGGGLYNGAITSCSSSLVTTAGVVTGVTTTCSPATSYSFNATPDFILKAAVEPGFGHYEIFGIFSRFRDRVYPCAEFPVGSTTCTGVPATTGAYNFSRNGGGVGANARVTIAKKVDFGLHAVMGNGVGRYGNSTLPDATVNPDGTLALLRSYQGLATLEFHLPKFDIYFNGGEEYIGRRYSTDPVSTKVVGYGAPANNVSGCYTETVPGSSLGTGFSFGSLSNCSADTHYLVEGTLGVWFRLYNGPKGRLQFGPQYSYLTRNAWTGKNGAGTSAPHGIDNMAFASFRYYLP
jgi:hypothetical protein